MPLRVFARAVDWGWWARRLPLLVGAAPLTLVILLTMAYTLDGKARLLDVGVLCVILGIILAFADFTYDRDWRVLYRKPVQVYRERALQIALEDTKRAAQAGDLSIKE